MTVKALNPIVERRILFSIAAVLLAAWCIVCATDFNHPPGTRYVRLAAVAFVMVVGCMEYLHAWLGVYALAFLWPYGLYFREYASEHFSVLFNGLPEFLSGPIACSIVLGMLGRGVESPQELPHEAWIRYFRVSLWTFLITYTLSGLVGFCRLNAPPPSWNVAHASYRQFLTTAISQLTPLQAIARNMPAVLLALSMLNRFSTNKRKLAAKPAIQTVLLLFASSGLIAIVLQFMQIHAGLEHWAQGPFEHRNTAGPMFVLFSMLSLAGVKMCLDGSKWMLGAALGVCSLFFLIAVYLTRSRNAILMVVAFLWLLLFLRGNRKRVLLALLTPIVLAVAVFCMPLPHSDSFSDTGWNRLLQTFEAARAGDIERVSGDRVALYKTAINIVCSFPVAGSGVGTFPLLASEGSPYRSPGQIDAYGAAHSMPLNLAAESGILTSLAWLLTWVFLPWGMLIWAPRAGLLTLALLLFGLGNLLDTPWLSSGVANFSSLLLVLACYETAGTTA